MVRTFKIDFYTVTVPNGSPPFERLILDDAKSANDETRTVEIFSYPMRLQEAHSSHGVVEGDMLKIQMFDLPARAKLNGEVKNLVFTDDEGLGGETAFLYHPGTQVLVVQRNRTGVSAKGLADYFTHKASPDGPIILTPVIQPDALARLSKMKETRRLKIRFAEVTAKTFRDPSSALKPMIGVLEHFRAPSATIELSMGHQQGSLLKQPIMSIAKYLFNQPSAGSGDVAKMEVSGVLDDDSTDVFDVLMYRMVELGKVEVNAYRRSPYSMRRPQISAAWSRRRKDLEGMFGS